MGKKRAQPRATPQQCNYRHEYSRNERKSTNLTPSISVLCHAKDRHDHVDELLPSRLWHAAELFANQALIQRNDFADFHNRVVP